MKSNTNGQIKAVEFEGSEALLSIGNSEKVDRINFIGPSGERIRSADVDIGETTVRVPWFVVSRTEISTLDRGEHRFVAVSSDGKQVGEATVLNEPQVRIAEVHHWTGSEGGTTSVHESSESTESQIDHAGAEKPEQIHLIVENTGTVPALIEGLELVPEHDEGTDEPIFREAKPREWEEKWYTNTDTDEWILGPGEKDDWLWRIIADQPDCPAGPVSNELLLHANAADPVAYSLELELTGESEPVQFGFDEYHYCRASASDITRSKDE